MLEIGQWTKRLLFGVILGVCVYILGCTEDPRQVPGVKTDLTTEEMAAMREKLDIHDELLSEYIKVKEDYAQAKLVLEQIAAEMKKPVPGLPEGDPGLLYFTYCRLYVLEKREGNDAAAKANMVKLRYWWLVHIQHGDRDVEEDMKLIEQYTSDEHIQSIVESMDGIEKAEIEEAEE